MHNKIGIMLGVAMLAIAGVVVQQSGPSSAHLQGSLWCPWCDTSSTSSTPGCGPVPGQAGACNNGACGTPGWICQWVSNAGNGNGACTCVDPGSTASQFSYSGCTSDTDCLRLFAPDGSCDVTTGECTYPTSWPSGSEAACAPCPDTCNPETQPVGYFCCDPFTNACELNGYEPSRSISSSPPS